MDKTGNFNAEIIDVNFIEHRFQTENPEQLELKIDFQCDEGKGSAYLDLSSVKYIETGKLAGTRSCDASNAKLKSLFNIDLNVNPQDLPNIKGQTAGFWGKGSISGTIYYSLSGNTEIKKNPKEAFEIMKQIFGKPDVTPSVTPPPAVQTPIVENNTNDWL